MKIKRVLILTPLVLFGVFGLSLYVAKGHFESKLNQLVLSSIGDAERLNPILFTDSASGDVCDEIFNGLLKYNQDTELIGDLAESYEIRQVSLLFPRSDREACRKRLQKALDAREIAAQGIVRLSDGVHGSIQIELSTAGTEYQSAVLKVIPQLELRPIHLSTLLLDDKYSFPGKKPCTAGEVIARLKEHLTAEFEVLEYFEENSSTVAIKYLSDTKLMEDRLKAFFTAKRPEQKPEGEWKDCFGKVVATESGSFDNAPVVTFHLRKDVRWHDGEPFTSADVRFTLDKLLDEKTNTVRRSNFEMVKRMETPDPYTVIVVYKKPFSPCLETWGMGILPKHLLENEDINTAAFNRHPVGTGRFKFFEWKTDEQITVVANDDYFRGRPELDRISWRIIPETALRMLEFQMEGVDFDGVEPHEYDRMSKDARFKVYERLSNGYTYIGWNQKSDLFKDKRVRTALTYAVNRDEIVKYVLYGRGVTATGPFPPQMWYSNPDVKPLPFDPDKARALLAEAGWRDSNGDGVLDKDGKPFRFDLITNNGNQQRMDVCVVVQRQLERLGIKASILSYEWSVFIRDKINPRDYEACVLGWSLGYDPDVYEIWHSSQIPKGFNFTAYANPEVDRLIEAGRTEYDREKRKKIYFKIHDLIAEDQPYTFLYVPLSTPALHAGKFRMRRKGADGTVVVEDIAMTKAGLTYYMDHWFRVRSAELTP